MAHRHADLDDVPGVADLVELPGLADLDDAPGVADLVLVPPGALNDEWLALQDEARPYVQDEVRCDVPGEARRPLDLFPVEREVVVVVELYQTLEGELSISWWTAKKVVPVLPLQLSQQLLQ